MDDVIRSEPWLLIPLIAIVGGFSVAIISTIVCTIGKIAKTRAYEQSRREIAAYIAEGSMSPEEGERILDKKA
ncbi:MAG: hypothetical protein D6693_11325 [Planctomycetota bacterium]|nr:MAG: hypothetical protein D6693_11325 [Planctomycetota bacterium]